MSFLRSFACCWCIAFVLHEVLLTTPVLSDAVSSLFSPGAHTPRTSLGIAAGFLLLRAFVILLWPVAVLSAVRVFRRTLPLVTVSAQSMSASTPARVE